MSILQEYEQIRKEMGEDQWSLIEAYLAEVRPDLRLDEVLYKEEKYNDFAAWARGERNECDILGEIFKELNELSRHEFFINMADHLDSEDYQILHEIYEKQKIIKKLLKDNYGIDYYKLEERREI